VSNDLFEQFFEISHFLFDFRNFASELAASPDSSVVELLTRFMAKFPDSIDEAQIRLFEEMLAGDDASSTPTQPEVHLDAAVIQVKEMFPDLGTVFVQKLLEFYKNNVAEAISALLEDNLHPSLMNLDRKEEPPKPKAQTKSANRIPNLYHKKAKKSFGQIGNREEQIFVNAVAAKYKYVDDEDEEEIDGDTGIAYQTKSTYRDEYDDTYDDEFEKSTFDPIAAVNHESRQRERIRQQENPEQKLQQNPNMKNLIARKNRGGRVTQLDDDDAATSSESSRPSSSASSNLRRADKVSQPKSFRDYHMQNKQTNMTDLNARMAKTTIDENRQKNAEKLPAENGQRNRRKLDENSSALDKRRKDSNKARVGNHNRKAMAKKKQSRGMI